MPHCTLDALTQDHLMLNQRRAVPSQRAVTSTLPTKEVQGWLKQELEVYYQLIAALGI